MRVQVQASNPASLLPLEVMFPFAFVNEGSNTDEAAATFEAPGIDRRVVSGVGDDPFIMDDDDDWDFSGGACSSVVDSGGKRFELRKMRSGGIVSRLCLKTYLAMADAKIAGWAGVAEGETAPFAIFLSFSAIVIFSSSATSSAVSSFVVLSFLPTDQAFRQGCKVQPFGFTLPFFTKWLTVYSHF